MGEEVSFLCRHRSEGAEMLDLREREFHSNPIFYFMK